jgi:hypothetical protein
MIFLTIKGGLFGPPFIVRYQSAQLQLGLTSRFLSFGYKYKIPRVSFPLRDGKQDLHFAFGRVNVKALGSPDFPLGGNENGGRNVARPPVG